MLAILRQLSKAGPLLAQHVGSYLELAADDTARLAQALLRRLLLGVASLLGAALTLLIACAWVLALAWQTPWRALTFIGLLVVFGGLTAGAAMLTRRPWPAGEQPFARLGEELHSDRQLIDEIAGEVDAGEPEPAAIGTRDRLAG